MRDRQTEGGKEGGGGRERERERETDRQTDRQTDRKLCYTRIKVKAQISVGQHTFKTVMNILTLIMNLKINQCEPTNH